MTSHSVVWITQLLPSSEASERLTEPCRVQLPPLPLVCSADASAAFASISSLYIGTASVLDHNRTLFLSAMHSLRMLSATVKKRHWRTSVLWPLCDSSRCHLLSAFALPNHSACVSTQKGFGLMCCFTGRDYMHKHKTDGVVLCIQGACFF